MVDENTDQSTTDERPRVPIEVDAGPPAFDDAREAGGFVCAGPGRPPAGPRLPVRINPYLCPWCTDGVWPDGSRCLHCAGSGVAPDDTPGVDDQGDDRVPERMARPPGVMRRSCIDCAYRPGSYEKRTGVTVPGPESVFFCHHGLTRTGPPDQPGYVAPVMVAGMPIGAMVCGAWWDIHVDGQPPPVVPFRDPGGADRGDDAPAPP